MMDPLELAFDSARWDAAAARLRKIAPQQAADVLEAVKSSETLSDFMEHYDFGEPEWNGSLIVLASTLLTAPPSDVVIESYEELPLIDEDYGRRFHHGNVKVEGSFEASESIWITGSLQVNGVLSAGFLDAFPDLLVAGHVRAAAASFGGLGFVGGDLSVEEFVMIEAQGETIVRGTFTTPLLLGDHGSGSEFPQDNIGRYLDISKDKPPFDALSAALKVAAESSDEFGFYLVHRALDALR
jgi:hypothetical protein